MVQVGNIPNGRQCWPSVVVALLEREFAPYGLAEPPRLDRVSLKHGYIRVQLPSLEQAVRACEQLAGKLQIEGQTLSVSLPAGRADALFPHLSYQVWGKMPCRTPKPETCNPQPETRNPKPETASVSSIRSGANCVSTPWLHTLSLITTWPSSLQVQ